jgi:hypothetical protein
LQGARFFRLGGSVFSGDNHRPRASAPVSRLFAAITLLAKNRRIAENGFNKGIYTITATRNGWLLL